MIQMKNMQKKSKWVQVTPHKSKQCVAFKNTFNRSCWILWNEWSRVHWFLSSNYLSWNGFKVLTACAFISQVCLAFSSTQSICNQAACRIPENVNAHKKVRETLEKRKAQLQQGGGHRDRCWREPLFDVSSDLCDLCESHLTVGHLSHYNIV